MESQTPANQTKQPMCDSSTILGILLSPSDKFRGQGESYIEKHLALLKRSLFFNQLFKRN